MKRIKKYMTKKNLLIAGIAAVVLLVIIGALFLLMPQTKDTRFYEVKCLFVNEDITYSFIIEDKATALDFKKDMGRSKANPAKCKMSSYPDSISDETLSAFYNVNLDVVFAIKEYHPVTNHYQVQYFNSDYLMSAFSCQYKSGVYNCYTDLSEDFRCPLYNSDAKKSLENCEYKAARTN